ncbi:MAG TPA: DUF5700 domain-containing putative Zn-dependent protease [Usitatibacter sp.]|nr:DUF5700 domain-containing putative Zn-dependent protease [Usitatibacter sp.]
MQRSRRHLLMAPALLMLPRVASARAGSTDAIEIDTAGVDRLLRWAAQPSADDPPEWKGLEPYRLAKLQAKWSGIPDPDLEAERLFERVRALKADRSKRPPLQATAAFVAQIRNGAAAFPRHAAAVLERYLPAETPIEGKIVLALFLPNYAFAWDRTIVVSVTHPFWRHDASRFFNLMIHELFHIGFIRYQQGSSPAGARDAAELRRDFLWTVQNEGMATYVAYTDRPRRPALDDYAMIDDPALVGAKFEACRRLLADLASGTSKDLPILKQRVLAAGITERIPYVVGAVMAKQIEAVRGRPTLVDTIRQGPEAFFRIYGELPGALHPAG